LIVATIVPIRDSDRDPINPILLNELAIRKQAYRLTSIFVGTTVDLNPSRTGRNRGRACRTDQR
jgi:hypothetical protein